MAKKKALPDPALPLRNKRHETFAQRRAKGASLADAWKATIPFGKTHRGGNNSLRVSGHRAQTPATLARIKWLIADARQAAGDVQQTFNRADVIKLCLEVSDALQDAYENGIQQNIAPQRLEQMRTVLASHLARQSKLIGADDEIPDAVQLPHLAFENMGDCKCPR